MNAKEVVRHIASNDTGIPFWIQNNFVEQMRREANSINHPRRKLENFESV